MSLSLIFYSKVSLFRLYSFSQLSSC